MHIDNTLCMKIVIPVCGERIASVFDTADQFRLFWHNENNCLMQTTQTIAEGNVFYKVRKIDELGGKTIICGAISQLLDRMFMSFGIRVIPNTCGSITEVIDAFYSGKLTDRAFLLPGCNGNRRQRRFRYGQRNRS